MRPKQRISESELTTFRRGCSQCGQIKYAKDMKWCWKDGEIYVYPLCKDCQNENVKSGGYGRADSMAREKELLEKDKINLDNATKTVYRIYCTECEEDYSEITECTHCIDGGNVVEETSIRVMV